MHQWNCNVGRQMICPDCRSGTFRRCKLPPNPSLAAHCALCPAANPQALDGIHGNSTGCTLWARQGWIRGGGTARQREAQRAPPELPGSPQPEERAGRGCCIVRLISS